MTLNLSGNLNLLMIFRGFTPEAKFVSSKHLIQVHFHFKWLPSLIGQVCSQVWYSPYLAANFGFFELRTFPWSPSKV